MAAPVAARADERQVLTDNVNIRTGPGLRYNVAGQLDKGDVLRVLATRTVAGESWHRAELAGGRIGWVAARFVSRNAGSEGPLAAPSSRLAPEPATETPPASAPIGTPEPVVEAANIPALPIVDVPHGASLHLRGPIGAVADLDFTVVRKGGAGPGVLVFGGIQGDEPGGFSAASLLATHYDVSKGTLIVAPNLNFPSIVDRSRGTCGDMNRKFADLAPHDPQYIQVNQAQQLIRQPGIDLILNLHDGSGFYHGDYKSALRNPRRWGQSVIIDKATGADGSSLAAMAERTAGAVNAALLKPDHRIGVRNTHTDEGNVEMAKTLTWFAVRSGKTAFGLEASKELNVADRTYYHLRMVEAFLTQAGVEFTRRFSLTPGGIAKALSENARYAVLEPRTVLPLHNIRPRLAGELSLTRPAGHFSTSPLLAVTTPGNDARRIQIHYGNNLLTQSAVRWYEADASLDRLPVTVDGEKRDVRFGEVVPVRTAFIVDPVPGYRVNAIGATAHASDESGINLTQKHFQSAYSIDRSGQFYRVETYRDDRLVGMFVVAFGIQSLAEADLPDLPGLTATTEKQAPTRRGAGYAGR